MQIKALLCCALLALTGCGASEPPEPPAEAADEPRDPSVFDPLTSTIDRAKGVQQTLDEQAAERRRQLEEAER